MELRNVNTNNGRVVFELWLEKDEWTVYLQKASNAMQKQKAVQGYRAGKAPLAMAYKTYGKALIDRALNAVIDEEFMKACVENEWMPVSQPNIQVVAADLEQFCALCSFYDYPKIEDVEYRGLVIEKPVRTVTEEEVDEAIAKYMRNHLYVHEVPREARMGDIVEVSFTGTHNGGRFDYDHSDKSRWIVGSGQLFTGLDEAIVGHVAGDDLELTLTMPEDFHREAVRGLTLDLKVHLKGVWARDLLECTDEYVKENVKGCETVADLRAQKRRDGQLIFDNESKTIFNKRLDKAIAALVTCPVPESMIDVSMQRHIATLRYVAASEGKTAEQSLADEGKTMQDFMELVRPNCELQVRTSILLDYVIRKEGLQLTRQELDKYIASRAKSSNTSTTEVVQRLGGEESIIEKLLNDRAMKIIRDSVVVVEVPVDEFPAE